MVEIIDMTPSDKVARDTICHNCGVTLRYVPRDVRKHAHTYYGECTEIVKYITCPNCNNKTLIK